MINLFQPQGFIRQWNCGSVESGTADSTGRCKDSQCGRKSPMLLGGYCPSCAVLKGMTPLKACGVEPIRLTSEATVAAAGAH